MALTNEQFAQFKAQLQAKKQSTPAQGLPNDQFQALKEKLKQQKIYNTAANSGIVPDIPKTGLPTFEKPLKDTFVAQVFTGNTQKLGKTTGEALNANYGVKLYTKALDDYNNNLLKYKDNPKALQYVKKPELSDFVGTDTARRLGETFGQNLKEVGGQALGTVVEATGVGALKGIKGFGLAKNIAQTAEEAAKARQAFRALPLASRLGSIAKDTGKTLVSTVPFGYGYDVSQNLQEGKEGLDIVKPGWGTGLSTGLPIAGGLFKAGREITGEALPYVAANISGEPVEAYKRAQTGQLDDLIPTASKEKTLLETRGAVSNYRKGMLQEFGDAIDTISEKYKGDRIGLSDTDTKKLSKVAETFGFDMPSNPQSLSGKETVDLITNLNENYIPNASTSVDISLNNSIKQLKDTLKKRGVEMFGGETGEFAKAYKDYAVKSKVYKDVASIVGKVGERTPLQINAARNRLSNIFSESSTGYLDAIRQFEDATGERILDKVAAAKLNPYLPKTLRGAPANVFGFASDALALLTYPISSPRIGSKVIKFISGFDEPMLEKLMKLAPQTRKAIYDAVNKENMAFDEAVKKFTGYSPVNARNIPVTKDITSIAKTIEPKIANISTTLPQNKGIVNKAIDKFKNIPNKQGGFISTGYKGESDLTTKILKDLEGKTTVSKQYILDATNRGELKQVERDLIRQVLDDVGKNSDPLYDYKNTKGVFSDEFKGKTEVMEAINDLGGIKNVRAGLLSLDDLKPTEIYSESNLGVQRVLKEIKSGVNTPIIVDEGLNIIDGNHRYVAQKMLGKMNVKVVAPKEVLPSSDTINVADFAKKVKAELLPLDTFSSYKPKRGETENYLKGFSPRYESITLPDELRGKVKDYRENIYQSPIKTSAGATHFSNDTDNYFGHTRIEDMADNKTRRVIEVQSDLYQKGNLDKEGVASMNGYPIYPEARGLNETKIAEMRRRGDSEAVIQKLIDNENKAKKILADRQKEVAKLQQYNSPTAHFRMIREEIKKAAQDGKTKLQFPTGETAMRIEGLGKQYDWFAVQPNGMSSREFVKPEQITKGSVLRHSYHRDNWIVTEVDGSGTFKAIQEKQVYQNIKDKFGDISESDIISFIKNCL